MVVVMQRRNRGPAWYGIEWYRMAKHSMTFSDMEWGCVEWRDMALTRMAWMNRKIFFVGMARREKVIFNGNCDMAESEQ